MRSDLIIYDIAPHSDEWYAFRKREGIGGSECGTILGINKYDSSARLYHEKVGTYTPEKIDNRLMFWGREHEDKIAEIWQFWDGTPDGYIENRKAEKVIRRGRKINGYVVNPDYPWLYASLDRVINRDGGFNMITGEPLQTEGVLECKTLSFWASNVWQDGIPPYYLAQVHQYMLILGVDYSEIAILKDGNTFDVEYIERDENLSQRILTMTHEFWYKRVLPAREAKVKRDEMDQNRRVYDAQQQDAIIQQLEPDPDTSEAYKDFMNERYLHERTRIKGTMKLYTLCKKDQVLKMVINGLIAKRNLIKNMLMRVLVDNGTDYIDFGDMGGVRWVQKKGQENRELRISIKEKPQQEAIDEQTDFIDLNMY